MHLLATLRAGSPLERVTRVLSETASLRSLVVAPGGRPGCLRLSAWVECPAGEIPHLLGALGFIAGLEGLEWAVAEPRRAREYALLEVAATGEARSRVIEVASVFRGRVVDAREGSLTLELSGLPDELDAAHDLLFELGFVDYRSQYEVWATIGYAARVAGPCVSRAWDEPPQAADAEVHTDGIDYAELPPPPGLDDAAHGLGCSAPERCGSSVGPHLLVGVDDVHPFLRGRLVDGSHRHHRRPGGLLHGRPGTFTWPLVGTLTWPRTTPGGGWHPRWSRSQTILLPDDFSSSFVLLNGRLLTKAGLSPHGR